MAGETGNSGPDRVGQGLVRWVALAVGVGIGGVLVLAAWLKIKAPSSFVAVVLFLLPSGTEVWTGRVLAVGVVGWEVLLGVSLVGGVRSRAVLGGTIATIALFSGALIYLALTPDAPGCGCFGPLSIARRAGIDLWPGVVRNGAILVALAWLWTQRAPTGGSGRASPVSRDTPAGFTLVETLVTISVIAVVLALALPGLRAGRRQGLVVASLATHRQLLAGLSMYAAEFDGSVPSLATRGHPHEPLPVGRTLVQWDGYFRDQSRHWHTLVNPGYVGLPEEALAIPERLTPGEWVPRTPSGLLWAVRYHLTHTAFAAPLFWRDHPGSEFQLDASLLRPVRLGDLSSPASKGLLIDIALGLHNPDGDPGGGATMPVGWGDGSAGLFDASVLDGERYVSLPPLGAIGLPVWATRQGFSGRDRD